MKQGLDVEATKLQVELSKSKIELERTSVAEAVLDMKTKTSVGALKRQIEQLSAENALAAEKRKSDQSKLADEQLRATAAVLTLGAQIQNRDLEDKWRDEVNKPVTYTMEPFKDGVLTVSDRRIEMNGPIVSGTADFVCAQIDYFNNQNQKTPIFVVINNSPGGSVMAGYRILKAIETSDAPVHVVVKSFAASMAATIATLAPHSYAYPNAIILHHQMSGSAVGNMTNMEQEVATMQEWERRLAVPIAKKMGISLEQFKAKMYAAKKSGDWDEFADKALELKWIDHIVNEIREEGVRSKPSPSGSGSWWMSAEKSDEQGKPYVSLPPLEPYDCYFMINPHGFYRVDGR
jgi:ATP-dependent Clp protease protease subunit